MFIGEISGSYGGESSGMLRHVVWSDDGGISTSKTSVNFYQTARHNIPEDSHLDMFVSLALSLFKSAVSSAQTLVQLMSHVLTRKWTHSHKDIRRNADNSIYYSRFRLVIEFSCRSQWPCGLRRGYWPVGCWDRGFESCSRHRCLSASFFAVLSCVGRDLATG
jgi:hypothetical protein